MYSSFLHKAKLAKPIVCDCVGLPQSLQISPTFFFHLFTPPFFSPTLLKPPLPLSILLTLPIESSHTLS